VAEHHALERAWQQIEPLALYRGPSIARACGSSPPAGCSRFRGPGVGRDRTLRVPE